MGFVIVVFPGHSHSLFYRCLDHGLKICILFGYNPQIILSLFHKMNLELYQDKSVLWVEFSD